MAENPFGRKRKSKKGKRRKNPSGKQRRSGRRRRNPSSSRRGRRRNPSGAVGGVVQLATQGAGVVAGGIATEVVAAMAKKYTGAIGARVPWWAAELVVAVGGSLLLRKVGLGRFARPFALGGMVIALRDLAGSQQLTGISLARRFGLGDFVTDEQIGELPYGVMGMGDGAPELLGIGDYMTMNNNGVPAWAQ